MKKTISLLLALLLCIGLTSPALAADAPFTDVPSTHWAYKEIMKAYKDGAVQGTSANTYNPNGNVTMAQFIAILTRAFCPEQVEASAANDAWYAANYEAADYYDLFFNVPDRSPETEVTREVMARIMYNLLVEQPYGPNIVNFSNQELQAIKAKIPDFGSVGSSMGEAVETCYALGLITGIDSSGKFSPQGGMTRAQTAVIYVRLKQVMETGTGIASQTGTGTSAETSGATLTNGQSVTVDNVLALLDEYRKGKAPVWEKAIKAGFTSYKDGAKYDAYEPQYYSAARGRNGIECAKFAYAFWDELFGDLPMREVTNYENIRPGDLIHYPGHWAIATCKPFYKDDDTIDLWIDWVSGDPSGDIGWQKDHSSWSTIINSAGPRLDGAWTRYPD